MANQKKKAKGLLRVKLGARTALRIAPLLILGLLGGKYVLDSFEGEFISYDKLKSSVESTDETYVEETEVVEDVAPEVATPEPTEEPTVEEEVIETIPYPEIIEDVETEVISSELLDSGYNFDSIDFEALRTINPDACGWITIDGTNIDFPILQGEDNVEYLDHDIYGNESRLGSIYIDSRNNSLDNATYDLSDFTIIYGHHISGARMFAQLCNYKSQSYYDNHDFGIIYTPDGYAYKMEIFAGVIIDGSDETSLFTSDFVDEAQFDAYVNNIVASSTFDSDIEVEYGDKIVALVTCSYEFDNARYVLYARLNKQYINEMQIENNLESSTLSR